MLKINRCIICGCTDNKACIHRSGMPCDWSILDEKKHEGLCSRCEAQLKSLLMLNSRFTAMMKAAAVKIEREFLKTGKSPIDNL